MVFFDIEASRGANQGWVGKVHWARMSGAIVNSPKSVKLTHTMWASPPLLFPQAAYRLLHLAKKLYSLQNVEMREIIIFANVDFDVNFTEIAIV